MRHRIVGTGATAPDHWELRAQRLVCLVSFGTLREVRRRTCLPTDAWLVDWQPSGR